MEVFSGKMFGDNTGPLPSKDLMYIIHSIDTSLLFYPKIVQPQSAGIYSGEDGLQRSDGMLAKMQRRLRPAAQNYSPHSGTLILGSRNIKIQTRCSPPVQESLNRSRRLSHSERTIISDTFSHGPYSPLSCPLGGCFI